ncbi:hypothetical protein COY25_00350 [Candidatus Uhrbacteria bacterium CG_4_10_14_0_2_um_filter_41_7]|uniref:Uncharacterized protein n=1 Tax=Candidatus Uhrbacteria bacterium CG_4_9_14_3_um_filter_41_35 TaxID=1975034 RepID=A0A2M7XFL7_9BACT|nr:MAG: hypothetical protein COV92_01775 [Candidatus Uhrbacteria bacterium CG11_big_fil_rev_8_21_14_0_20_41_9]PIZ55715.1 MAG: hypothetical protein COY25_00350 [Candidatus Uhrbacteria bacterium CG_4_10_14_0_2_um_filter_41_7]PJA46645.1 MAG: hypothetical protein CO173_02655 [Candidatus Uhrbacteria bacterium CG_4_9_14_3_um_filter_41_35]
MSTKNEKQDFGYGGLRAPGKPKPVRVPDPSVNIELPEVTGSIYRTDEAGIPIIPQRIWREPKSDIGYHPNWRFHFILIEGLSYNRMQAIPSLIEWLVDHLDVDFSDLSTALAFLKEAYNSENRENFPKWAEYYLIDYCAENNIKLQPEIASNVVNPLVPRRC